MTVRELRLGNWIYSHDDKKPWQVTWLEDDGTEVDPIPLTPEILEKAGFEIHGDGGRGDGDSAHCKWGSLEVEYILGYSYFRIWGTAPWQIKIKYVHQLQNLYFALTGTELEIKL